MSEQVIFHKDYDGWESLQDWDRDMSEAIQSDMNTEAWMLNGEFEGTVRVTITYLPPE